MDKFLGKKFKWLEKIISKLENGEYVDRLNKWKYRQVTLFGLVILLIIISSIRGCSSDVSVEINNNDSIADKISKVQKVNEVDETRLIDKLPKGWVIRTNGSNFVWVDDDGYETFREADSYDEAVENAIGFYNRNILREDKTWIDLN